MRTAGVAQAGTGGAETEMDPGRTGLRLRVRAGTE